MMVRWRNMVGTGLLAAVRIARRNTIAADSEIERGLRNLEAVPCISISPLLGWHAVGAGRYLACCRIQPTVRPRDLSS